MKIFVKKILICIYRILNFILPKNSRIAVFSSSNGKAAGGNPRAIYEYAVRAEANTGYRFVWFLTDELLRKHPEEAENLRSAGLENAAGLFDCDSRGNDSDTDKKTGSRRQKASGTAGKSTCLIVRYGHPLYYWYMAHAGIWVFDSRQEPYITKRKGVRYLQTWHGTPLKKLGLDIDEMNMSGENRNIEEYREAFRREAAQWDYLIAQNSFSAETFTRCFDFHGEILKIGYPRNDVLVRTAQQKAAKTSDLKCSKDGFSGDEWNKEDEAVKNIGRKDSPKEDNRTKNCRLNLLYAPTWRDDRYIGGGWYAYSSPLDFMKLYEMLGDRFTITVKPHYLVKIRKGDLPQQLIDNGFLQVSGQSGEINDLYIAADGLITDYSSAMFDYSLLGRPMFFFAYDMEEYAGKLRGFYFDFEAEAPGPICRSTNELGDAVKEAFENGSMNAGFKDRIRRFTEKYNTYDDGNAAKKAWEYVKIN